MNFEIIFNKINPPAPFTKGDNTILLFSHKIEYPGIQPCPFIEPEHGRQACLPMHKGQKVAGRL